MNNEFDFISATDKPALLAFSTPEWLDAVKLACQDDQLVIYLTHSLNINVADPDRDGRIFLQLRKDLQPASAALAAQVIA